MSLLTPAQVRSGIEAGLLAALGAASPAWRVSRYGWRLFPGKDTRTIEDLAFAVGAPRTIFQDRQRSGAPVKVDTTISVRFGSRARGDAQVSDQTTALEREDLLIRTVVALTGCGAIRVESADRDQTPDGILYVSDVRFHVHHGTQL